MTSAARTSLLEDQYDSVNKAFTKQSAHFDQQDFRNPILRYMRTQVRQHVLRFLKPEHSILEINAGTGLDAVYFAQLGNSVHATEFSDGMVTQLRSKISDLKLTSTLTAEQLSYTELSKIEGKKFDYVFSNFGGLNCTRDLNDVSRALPQLLNPGAYVTWVVMPPACPWEWLSAFKGNFNFAFRRFRKQGALANLEGESFNTYYHSYRTIKKALGSPFTIVKSEGLGAILPPPDRDYMVDRHPALYKMLRTTDKWLRHSFPFNRWADHIIVTFRYDP